MTLLDRISSYLGNGGLVNPEMMEHDKVRDLLLEIRTELKATDTLRQQLAEAKGEIVRLDTAWQKEREICQKAETAIFDANRRNAELEQQLQQANAASGEDTKRLDWLNGEAEIFNHKPRVYGWTVPGWDKKDVRAAIDAAMEGSRTK